MMDGRLDYGAYATDAQRQDKLDIRTAKLVEGGEIAYLRGGESEAYVIKTLTSLLA